MSTRKEPGERRADEVHPGRADRSTFESPLRSHVVMTGALFQAVGISLLLGAFVLWMGSTRLVDPVQQPPERWLNLLSSERLPAAVLTIAVATAFVGGGGLLAAGIGLNWEKPSSGRLGVLVSACMLVIYAGSSIVLLARTDTWASAAATAVLALASLALLAFATHAAAIMHRFPPPRDQYAFKDEPASGPATGDRRG